MVQAVHKSVQVGDKAPDFTLPDQNGNLTRLKDVLTKNAVVLYFYPKDNTKGCTLEACTFRDSYEAFLDSGAIVIGVSADSVETHTAFAEKYKLPFVLLSDRDRTVHRLYGISNLLGIIPSRETFVIDEAGTVRHRFVSQINMAKHVTEALQMLQSLPKMHAGNHA